MRLATNCHRTTRLPQIRPRSPRPHMTRASQLTLWNQPRIQRTNRHATQIQPPLCPILRRIWPTNPTRTRWTIRPRTKRTSIAKTSVTRHPIRTRHFRCTCPALHPCRERPGAPGQQQVRGPARSLCRPRFDPCLIGRRRVQLIAQNKSHRHSSKPPHYSHLIKTNTMPHAATRSWGHWHG